MSDGRAFFAYPSQPASLAETVRTGAERLRDMGLVDIQLWEDLSVAGKVIIDSITEAILAADVTCFEVSGLNKNVMFELGFAIGANRKVWLLFDETDAVAKRKWEQMRILTTVGYVPYRSSNEIVAGFSKDLPFEPDVTIFQKAIEPGLLPVKDTSFFYFLSNHPTEASRQLSRLVRQRTKASGVKLIEADPSESSVYPITWYAQQIYSSVATLIHFAAERRKDADIHNARCSLVAGLAHGMRRPLLMVTEGDVLAPIDYRDLLRPYQSASDCVNKARPWLDDQLQAVKEPAEMQAKRSAALRLATELKSVRLGEIVAENEADELGGYFVETASYREVLKATTTIFVGRKGTGKTANLLRASAELESDKRNLVCVIKPSSYEMEALVKVLSKFRSRDVKGYLIDALWQYLLLTEIALAAADEIRARPAGPIPNTPEWELVKYLEQLPPELTEDFAVRLEQALDNLGRMALDEDKVAEGRQMIVERLHETYLRELRQKLGVVLQGRERVPVLIDNLDKAWDQSADLEELAFFLLGLLTAVGRVAQSFSKSSGWKEKVKVTLAVFIRSDIYSIVARMAREPDKLPATKILWGDPSLLLRVVEERYRAARGEESDPKEMWERFFEPSVSGLPTPDYICQRVLHRPRDIVYFCNAAVTAAINAGHEIVTEQDIRAADSAYSQFAVEALRVENGITTEDFEQLVYEFAGASAILAPTALEKIFRSAGISVDLDEKVTDRLLGLSFLGLEIRDGEFRYFDETDELQKAKILSSKLAHKNNRPARFCIHPAFRPYLEISSS